MRIEIERGMSLGSIGVTRADGTTAVRSIPGGEAVMLRPHRRYLRLSKRELDKLRAAEQVLHGARELLRDAYGRDERGNAWCDYANDEVEHKLGCGWAFLSEAREALEGDGLLVSEDHGGGWEHVGEW